MKMFPCRIAVLPVVLFASSVWMSPQVAHAAPTVATTKTLDHALDADLRAAVKAKDVSKVRDLLKRNADPNTKDTDKDATPLLCLAAGVKSDIGVVQALVEAGADLEPKNSRIISPLAISALYGRFAVLQYLIKAGAKIEGNVAGGETPLMFAVDNGYTDVVRLLLASGANVNARSDDNNTPLIYGSDKNGDGMEIVKMLVNAGADVSVKADNGKNAIDTADTSGWVVKDIADYLRTIEKRDNALLSALVQLYEGRTTADSSTRSASWKAVKDALANGANPRFSDPDNLVTSLMALTYDLPGADDATVQKIIARSDLNAQDKNLGMTALHRAVDNQNTKMVALLIKAGADLNVPDNAKETPLDIAYLHNNQSVIDALVKAGAHENALKVDADGNTKLMLLVAQKPFDATRAAALVKAGVDVNATNKKIDTALLYACVASSPDAVTFLIKNGANVNYVDTDGATALIYSAQLESADDALAIVTALVAAKADVNAKSHKGNTALILANANSNLRAAAVLVKAGAKDDSSPESKSSTSDTSSTGSTIPTTDALKVDDDGITTLMLATSDTPFDAVKAAALIKAGVDVNAVDKKTESTLIDACVASSPDAVRFLLKNGAKVNYADKDGGTALIYGLFADDKDQALDMVQQLIAAGADVNVKGSDGTTALDVARAKGNARCIDALIKAGAK